MLEIWSKGVIPCKNVYKIKKLQQKGESNFKYSVRQSASYSLKGVPIVKLPSANVVLVGP